MKRKTIPGAALAALAAVALVGCGSNSESSTSSVTAAPAPAASATSSTSTSATSTAAAVSSGPNLKDIGTITTSAAGTKFSASYSLGPIMYGKNGQLPPPDALSACNANYSTEEATDGYIEGTVTLSYTEGSVPTIIGAEDSALGSVDIDKANFLNAYALQENGNWVCPAQGQDPGADAITLQPGATVTYPMWIFINDASSNASPTIPASQASVITIDLGFTSDQVGPDAKETVSGPQAADCSNANGSYLLPYAKLPLTSEGCTHIG